MTVGLPGAGIGGLFYLLSTILLPIRSLIRRMRRAPDAVADRQLLHTVSVAAGVIASLWMMGWILAFAVPRDLLRSASSSAAGASPQLRTMLPAATFMAAVATLLVVLGAVEVARFSHARRQAVAIRHTEWMD